MCFDLDERLPSRIRRFAAHLTRAWLSGGETALEAIKLLSAALG
ncbi:MAG TPA: hypothetical protein PK027_10185 [Aquimonas sp.]|nr:hypothetical protein [Aquimonas sp.]HRF54809.1 hypothetical protein [Aquimonas sp.]